jgi:hypothetical protein
VIVAFSTSSRIASVALFDTDGRLICSGEKESNNRASEACLRLVDELEIEVQKATLFLGDIGPGSFTGTRVGVVLAKTFAWTFGAQCGGASAFDLISVERAVVFPSKKGEWFVREPGEPAIRISDLPQNDWIGFGPGIEEEVFPHAKRFGNLLSGIDLCDPLTFVPQYLIEPSISTPKRPLSEVSK